jgi:MFS family permease
MVALIFSTSSLFISPFALFLKPVSEALHWTPAIYPQSLLIISILYAVVGPLAGRGSDRFGARRIVLAGMACFVVGLIGMSTMSASIPQMYVWATLLGIAAPLVGPATLAPVVAGWFDRGRGLMMGLILGAAPQIAAAALSPLISRTIESYGWRNAYRLLALSALIVAVPVTLRYLRNAGGGMLGAADGLPAGASAPTGMTLRQATRGRAFWLILSAGALLALVYGGVSGHLVAWQSDHGLSAAFGAEALSSMFIGAVVGPIVAGACADRILRPQVLAPFVATPLLGLLLLSVHGHTWVAITGATLVGFGFSAWIGQTSVLVTRYFGLRSTGEISGVLISAGGVCLGVGPVLLGVARSIMASYEPAIVICIAVLAIPPICVLVLPPYNAAPGRMPGRSGDRPQEA